MPTVVCEECQMHYRDSGVCDEGKPVNSPHRRRETTQVLYLGPGEVPADAKLIPESEALQRIASAVADEAFRHWCRLMEKYESAAYLADERAFLAYQAQQDAKTLMRMYGEAIEEARRKEKLADLCLDAYAAQLNTACGLAFDSGMKEQEQINAEVRVLQLEARLKMLGAGRSFEFDVTTEDLDLARYGV